MKYKFNNKNQPNNNFDYKFGVPIDTNKRSETKCEILQGYKSHICVDFNKMVINTVEAISTNRKLTILEP